MSRKQFIMSHGATCKNWTWSWSFINEAEKFIIFGAWDVLEEGNRSKIFTEEWVTNNRGKKPAGYDQSREHIRLIEEEGYSLKTFRLIWEAPEKSDKGAPPTIKDFVRQLEDKELLRIGDSWYAVGEGQIVSIPEEVDISEVFVEGAIKSITVNKYERNAAARSKCLSHYGYECIVCGFNFEEKYGKLGRKYIHVHHVVPISEIGKEYELDPISDLVPICPNCHAMIHSTRPALSVEQLKLCMDTV